MISGRRERRSDRAHRARDQGRGDDRSHVAAPPAERATPGDHHARRAPGLPTPLPGAPRRGHRDRGRVPGGSAGRGAGRGSALRSDPRPGRRAGGRDRVAAGRAVRRPVVWESASTWSTWCGCAPRWLGLPASPPVCSRPASETPPRRTTTPAARVWRASFAVKEAVVKSLGIGISDVTLRDIELLDGECRVRAGGRRPGSVRRHVAWVSSGGRSRSTSPIDDVVAVVVATG